MIKVLLLSAFSGLLLVLSFPRFNFWFLAWVALVPLLVAIRGKRLKVAFGLCFLCGLLAFMGIFYWINAVSGFRIREFILLGLYLSCYVGFFGLSLNLALTKIKITPVIVAPVLWVSMEYLRSHAGFLALPWALLGHSQYLNLPVIQISSITGVYGISFLLVMFNAALSEIIQQQGKGLKPAVFTLVIILISVGYGFYSLSGRPTGEKLSVTVIQGNIPNDIKWKREYQLKNFNKHKNLTEEAVKEEGTSLIVWPETAVPGPIPNNQAMSSKLEFLARETQTYLLAGTSFRPKIGKSDNKEKGIYYNSAVLYSPQGDLIGKYDKIRLLPFAEYLPWRGYFPWPARYGREQDYIKGNKHTVFSLGNVKMATLICWESIFPDLVRQFVKNGAQFLVNVTNEAWFGKTAAPYQFVAMNVFRAVENRISIVRAANTGISCFIDPHGRLIGKVSSNGKDIFIEGYLTKDIPLLHHKTLYTRFGDIFAIINVITALIILTMAIVTFRNQM